MLLGTSYVMVFCVMAMAVSAKLRVRQGRVLLPASGPVRSGAFGGADSEFFLAVACCRWPVDDVVDAELAALIASGVDWPRFLATVRRHRIGGMANHALATRDDVPTEVNVSLAQAAASILHVNLKSLALQQALTQHFEAASVPFLVMKGLPLCAMLFGNLKVRQSKDIDLLIDVAQLAPAEKILADLGFQRIGLGTDLTPAQAAMWINRRKHFQYEHVISKVQLELHWRDLDNARMDTTQQLLRQRQWVQVTREIALPALQQDELLLSLCSHGAGHAWFRLKWLADVAVLLRQQPSADRAQLMAAARRRDLDRAVRQAITLCAMLFDVPSTGLPPETSADRFLLQVACDALLAQDTGAGEFIPKNLLRSQLLLRREWANRLGEMRIQMTSIADWKEMPLPRALYFLYPLLRLPLWLRRRRRRR